MIQRIQSVFLGLCAVCMFSLIFFPVWSKQSIDTAGESVVLTVMQMVHTQNGEVVNTFSTFFIGIVAFLSAAVGVGSILSYKDRMKQVKLNLLNTVLMITVVGLNVFFLFKGTQLFEIKNQGSFGIAFYLPLAGLIFNLLANRFIRKDEQLVRSVDRLR